MLFALSVVNALSRYPERYFKAFEMRKELYCGECESVIGERYRYVPASSERLAYEGEWTLYNAENRFVCDDPEILIRDAKYTQAHQFPDGIMQVMEPKGAAFSFETEADRICMPHVSAKAGLSATVYADGERVGEITCRSRWHGMNYFDSFIELPRGRKQIRFEIEDSTAEGRVFRFGYIVEAFRE